MRIPRRIPYRPEKQYFLIRGSTWLRRNPFKCWDSRKKPAVSGWVQIPVFSSSFSLAFLISWEDLTRGETISVRVSLVAMRSS